MLVTAIVFSSSLLAQTDSVKTLDPVITTGTKYPVKQSQSGKVVTVIDKETIEKSSGKTLGELLNGSMDDMVGISNNTSFNPKRLPSKFAFTCSKPMFLLMAAIEG